MGSTQSFNEGVVCSITWGVGRVIYSHSEIPRDVDKREFGG